MTDDNHAAYIRACKAVLALGGEEGSLDQMEVGKIVRAVMDALSEEQ